MAPTTTSRPALPRDIGREPAATAALLADVVSFGFVLVAILAVTAFDMRLGVLQVLAVMAIFGGLRYIAHELREDASKAALASAQRLAAVRAQSPSRWSVEQRDGYGRRVDARS